MTTNEQLKALQEENAGLKEKYKDLEKTDEILQKRFAEQAAAITTAKQATQAEQEKVTSLTEELTAVYQVNDSLKAEIESLTNPQKKEDDAHAFKKESFTLDGVKYGFNWHATHLNTRKVTSTEIAADESLQKELLKLGAGILKKI